MNFNKPILAIIALTGALLFIIGLVNYHSFAQTNQTSNNQTVDNKSSSSSDTLAKTSRINGSSIATTNEHAKLIKNPISLNQTNHS